MTLVWRPGYLAEGDLSFSNVSLLLHGNGTNGSTTITDNSPTPKTVTAVGNAQVSTAIADPFGNSTGVLAFDGTGDRLTTPSNNAFAFGTGDFTVEAWVYEAVRPIFPTVIEIGTHLATTGIIFLTNNGGNLAGIYSGSFFAMTATGSLAAWNHYAWVRSGNSIQTFVNGVGGGAASFTNNLTNATSITIGGIGGDYDLNGYIDDLRITKGVARYTANFTPPDAPLPDAQY